jgi:TRAP-type C4-dicarboxylate transport system substrate-binding protein
MRLVAAMLLLCSLARADVRKLRFAAIAPEGTAWAREINAFSRDFEQQTGGETLLKWYLGAIAGDEITALERLQKGQLDGMAGALFCARLAPSLRVWRVVGLFQDRDESQHVLGLLRVVLDEEMSARGVVLLGTGGFGSEIVFSRMPIGSLAELRRARMWRWSLDDVWAEMMPAMGLNSVPVPVEDSPHAYDEGRIDGWMGTPTAALAFQWAARARYFTDIRMAFLPGCVVVAKRAFDALPIPQQQALRTAAAKFAVRFEDLGRTQDEALVGRLFEKQGLKRVPVSAAFRAELAEEALKVRDKVPGTLVPADLLKRVTGWLADYRAQRAAKRP